MLRYAITCVWMFCSGWFWQENELQVSIYIYIIYIFWCAHPFYELIHWHAYKKEKSTFISAMENVSQCKDQCWVSWPFGMAQREAGDVWCLLPVWNLRAVIWFHFTISSLVLLPTPVALSVLSSPFFLLLFFLLAHSPDFLPENSSILFVCLVRGFLVGLWYGFCLTSALIKSPVADWAQNTN